MRSTICTRNPSGVRSISNWSLNGASAWLFSIAASSSLRSSSSWRRSSAAAAARASSCASVGIRLRVASPGSPTRGPTPPGIDSALAVGIILSEAPPGPSELVPGMAAVPSTALGFLKYSDTAAFCSLLAMPTSHMTRKNAIIAVTKSA